MDQMKFETKEEAAAYLSAMIDGEGCVEFRKMNTAKNAWRHRVRINNTSPGIIEAVESASLALDVPYTKHVTHGTNKPGWEINYPGPSIVKLSKVVRLADEGKAERLTLCVQYVKQGGRYRHLFE